jgi:hypothetical protein
VGRREGGVVKVEREEARGERRRPISKTRLSDKLLFASCAQPHRVGWGLEDFSEFVHNTLKMCLEGVPQKTEDQQIWWIIEPKPLPIVPSVSISVGLGSKII